jgi:hypothetical protein
LHEHHIAFPDPAGPGRQHIGSGAVHGDGGGNVKRRIIAQRNHESVGTAVISA